jgi:hypothetical protein
VLLQWRAAAEPSAAWGLQALLVTLLLPGWGRFATALMGAWVLLRGDG